MLWGSRTLNWEGEFDFKDQTNGFYGAIRLGDDKKKWGVRKRKMTNDSIIGKIWKFNYANKKQGEALATIEGSWL